LIQIDPIAATVWIRNEYVQRHKNEDSQSGACGNEHSYDEYYHEESNTDSKVAGYEFRVRNFQDRRKRSSENSSSEPLRGIAHA
jgi:hypothetical protein